MPERVKRPPATHLHSRMRRVPCVGSLPAVGSLQTRRKHVLNKRQHRVLRRTVHSVIRYQVHDPLEPVGISGEENDAGVRAQNRYQSDARPLPLPTPLRSNHYIQVRKRRKQPIKVPMTPHKLPRRRVREHVQNRQHQRLRHVLLQRVQNRVAHRLHPVAVRNALSPPREQPAQQLEAHGAQIVCRGAGDGDD